MVKYIRKNDYETAEFDGEWVILNTDQYTVTKLNDMGGHCWSIMNKAQSVESLRISIEQKYGQIDGEIKSHIESFLNELLECELIEYAV